MIDLPYAEESTDMLRHLHRTWQTDGDKQSADARYKSSESSDFDEIQYSAADFQHNVTTSRDQK